MVVSACALLSISLSGCGKTAPPEIPSDEPAAAQPSLQVAAVYSDDEIQLRIRFETRNPSWYHDYLVFLDLWQWRAHRSHPVGFADNGYVLDYRHGSSGRSMYSTNFDRETDTPLKMYDAHKSGFHALRLEKLLTGEYGQDDWYFLAEDFAVDFDPDHNWVNGDTLPRRILRQPQGSRGAIRASGGYSDGAWEIRLTRSMEAPDPRDSMSFIPGSTYTAAFAVHTGATGGRHHLVTVPVTVGLDAEATIVATKTAGDINAATTEWLTIPLFDPGDPTPPR